jgi:hypothetical protein
MERAGTELLQRSDLLDLIGASDEERRIWAIDPGYEGFTLTSRLDSFMVGNEPRFIEYNAESPAGIGFADVLSEIFFSIPALEVWGSDRPLSAFDAQSALLETVLWAYHQWGGKGTPAVAVIDWEDVITRRDFEIIADYFRDHGVATIITDPRRIKYRNGRAWAEGQQVDVIYRRVLLDQLLDKADEAADLLRAYSDGAICMVNSPRSKLLHKKALFALLSDGRLDLNLGREEEEVVNRCIPWTRIMTPGSVSYRDRQVDLASFVLDNKERLALKPIDDYGGHGVALGWDMSDEAWSRAVEASMGGLYVVQERVPVAEGEFPVWAEEGTRVLSLLVDTDPLLFRGRMGGILTRTSSQALLNVSAGTGSSTATIIVGA